MVQAVQEVNVGTMNGIRGSRETEEAFDPSKFADNVFEGNKTRLDKNKLRVNITYLSRVDFDALLQ